VRSPRLNRWRKPVPREPPVLAEHVCWNAGVLEKGPRLFFVTLERGPGKAFEKPRPVYGGAVDKDKDYPKPQQTYRSSVQRCALGQISPVALQALHIKSLSGSTFCATRISAQKVCCDTVVTGAAFPLCRHLPPPPFTGRGQAHTPTIPARVHENGIVTLPAVS
jgi:hypothetical protein